MPSIELCMLVIGQWNVQVRALPIEVKFRQCGQVYSSLDIQEKKMF